MAFEAPTHVADVLDSVLTALSGELTAAGRPVGRVVKFPGVPSWDCEMLAVYPRLRVAVAGVETSDQRLAQFRYVLDVNLVLLRCVTPVAPTRDALVPPAAIVDADGAGLAIDMWVVQRALARGARDGSLTGSSACQVTRLQPLEPQSPEGGYMAFTTTLEVTL